MQGLLKGIRRRAAARGMALAELARAAGMQPGNLRRMLMSNTASPRLGSVMRLLPPLHCVVGPAGARTAVELVEFLDSDRRRQDRTWEELLPTIGLDIGKTTASLSRPDRLSLGVVACLAEALHIELDLVDDPASPAQRKRPGRRSTGQEAGSSAPPTTSTPTAAGPPPPVHEAATPSASRPASTTSPPRLDPVRDGDPPRIGFGLTPLRPPRLGRYQTASPPAPRPRRPSTWTPPERSNALEGAVLSRLADVSSEEWSDGFTAALQTFANGLSVPVDFLERLGRRTFDALQRFRRQPRDETTDVAAPPPGCFDALDATPLLSAWQASREPGYRSTDTWLKYDPLGALAYHIALDGETVVELRLSPHGRPHRIIQIHHLPKDGPPTTHLKCEAALAIKIGGEVRSFSHVRAGPVFGALVVGPHTYLVAGVASLLAVVEVHADNSRIIWGGRAAALSKVNLEPPTPGTSVPGPVEPAPQSTDLAATALARDTLAAELAAAHNALALERRAREAAEQQLQATRGAVVHMESEFRAELTSQSDARSRSEEQAALAGRMLRKWIDAFAQKHQEWQAAVAQNQAAEERAATVETARAAAVAELTMALGNASDALMAETQRADAAEQANAELAAELRRMAAHFMTTADVAERERAEQAERLHAVEKELADLRKAQADDAAHLTSLVESNRIHEAITFFVGRVMGAPVEDIDRALDVLAQHAPPVPPAPTTPAPIFATQAPPSPARIRVGRNEPCLCGSGRKYKRCCWLAVI